MITKPDTKKRTIAWITADYFIDVDIPVIPKLANEFCIHWFVCISKTTTLNHEQYIRTNTNNQDIDIELVYLKNRIRNPLLILEYLNIILKAKKKKPDIFYIDLSGMPYFLPILRLLVGSKKTIIATHNVSTPKGAINQKFADLYMRFTLSAFKNLHVFSGSQKNILENKTKNKNILFAPLALKDYGISRKNPDVNNITFLNFGIIRDYKRIDVLIQAANIAYEKTNKKFTVKIAGSCEDWDKYHTLIKYPFLFDLKIETIPNEEIADLFSTSHYFVLPYQDIAQSGALTVALQYNIPIIASDLSSFREFILPNKTGFLFEPASVEELAKIMIYILENHNIIYPKLKSEQAQNTKENYRTESIIKKYTNYFNSFNI